MKKVLLVFPDALSMADFIFTQNLSNAEVNCFEQTITAMLTDHQIEIAEIEYDAFLKSVIPEK